MRRIYRYEFNLGLELNLSFNRDAKVVLLKQKGDRINVWIEHDPVEPQNYNWDLRLFATGESIPFDGRTNARDDWRHQASCSYMDNQFWHLYVKVSY